MDGKEFYIMEKDVCEEYRLFEQLFRWLIENDIPPGDVFERLIMKIIQEQKIGHESSSSGAVDIDE